jgi:hypothetical protein
MYFCVSKPIANVSRLAATTLAISAALWKKAHDAAH